MHHIHHLLLVLFITVFDNLNACKKVITNSEEVEVEVRDGGARIQTQHCCNK